jgi:hypothetical protein
MIKKGGQFLRAGYHQHVSALVYKKYTNSKFVFVGIRRRPYLSVLGLDNSLNFLSRIYGVDICHEFPSQASLFCRLDRMIVAYWFLEPLHNIHPPTCLCLVVLRLTTMNASAHSEKLIC